MCCFLPLSTRRRQTHRRQHKAVQQANSHSNRHNRIRTKWQTKKQLEWHKKKKNIHTEMVLLPAGGGKMKAKGNEDGGETSGEVKALGAAHPIISWGGSCLSAGLLNCTLSDSTTGPVEEEASSASVGLNGGSDVSPFQRRVWSHSARVNPEVRWLEGQIYFYFQILASNFYKAQLLCPLFPFEELVAILEENLPPSHTEQASFFLCFGTFWWPNSAKYCIFPSCLPLTNSTPTMKQQQLFIYGKIMHVKPVEVVRPIGFW